MMHFYRNRADRSSIYVERIQNVAGSTAGAGSADYYAYRNRRRDALAKANWDEKEAIKDGEQQEFEVRNVEERALLDMKADKKKSKREKKKANKETAKQAKQLNKYESNGDFMSQYLNKRGQTDQIEEAEGNQSQQSVQDHKASNVAATNALNDKTENLQQLEKPLNVEELEAISSNDKVVIQACDLENTTHTEEPQKVQVDSSKLDS